MKFYREFELISEPEKFKSKEYAEVFVEYGEDDKPDRSKYKRMEKPTDFLKFVETHGACMVRIGYHDIGLMAPDGVKSFLDTYRESFPSAFPVCGTSRGETFAYTRGEQGMGLYRLPEAGEEPEGEYLASSFGSMFFDGEGIEKIR